jgi:hypothetical protein
MHLEEEKFLFFRQTGILSTGGFPFSFLLADLIKLVQNEPANSGDPQ